MTEWTPKPTEDYSIPERDRWYNKRWIPMFRVTYEAFNEILDQIKPDLEPIPNPGPEPLSPAEKLAVCLYWLGHGGDYFQAHLGMNRSRSTVHCCVLAVCTALVKLAGKYIRWPTREEYVIKVTLPLSHVCSANITLQINLIYSWCCACSPMYS